MLNSFLNQLSLRKSSEFVFNQYQDESILNNLKAYITYLLEYRPNVLLIGEAPGYRGCRLTGIPFTSPDVITASKHNIFKKIGREIVLRKIVCERTATILWEFLDMNEFMPILWNAFPFHAHVKENQESNRKPTIAEIEEGKTYLKQIYNLFEPETLCSLGRVGESILKALFPKGEISYIRHPSYGGKKDFIKGMSQVISNTKVRMR